MSDGVKIAALEIENLKRVRALSLDCSGQALTVIGGRNGQGKTSVLDAIMWALGGDRFKPSRPTHEGAEEARVLIELDNGVTVERKGANGALKVSSTAGKGGQTLLNEFVNLFALNLPKFMGASGSDKAKMLLDAYPDLGVELERLNKEVKRLYDERHATGQIADRKVKYAEELPFDPQAPAAPLSGREMAQRMQDALAVNARNQALRGKVGESEQALTFAQAQCRTASERVEDLTQRLIEAKQAMALAQETVSAGTETVAAARKTVAALKDEDTTAIEAELEQTDSINARVRANESKRNAQGEAAQLRDQYDALGRQIEAVRAQRLQLLASVAMPLAELSVDEFGELIYRGQKWDCMSGAEQLQVAAAICAAIKPECGFVLLDKLECMDTDTLREFGEWLTTRGLQAIGTRVGTGDECSIVIEDGVSAADTGAGIKF